MQAGYNTSRLFDKKINIISFYLKDIIPIGICWILTQITNSSRKMVSFNLANVVIVDFYYSVLILKPCFQSILPVRKITATHGSTNLHLFLLQVFSTVQIRPQNHCLITWVNSTYPNILTIKGVFCDSSITFSWH